VKERPRPMPRTVEVRERRRDMVMVVLFKMRWVRIEVVGWIGCEG